MFERLNPYLRVPLRMLALSASTVTGRLRRGPRLPGWSVGYEIGARALRDFLIRLDLNAPAAARAIMAEELKVILSSSWRGVARESVDVDGIGGRWFRPTDGERRGTMLYFHGGGYTIGSVDAVCEFCSRLCLAAGASVLAIDYRLAPEHPYPAAIDDALTAVRWLSERGVRSDELMLGGDSAGGNLTLVTLLRLKELGEPLPAGALLLSPWVDLTADLSACDPERLDVLNSDDLAIHTRHYLGGADPADPMISPVYADLQGLPPLLVHAGGAEIFCEQIERFAARARAAGVQTELRVEPDMIHVWHMLAQFSRKAQESIDELGQFSRRIFSQ